MNIHHHTPRRLAALLLVAAVMLSLVPSAFAGQQNSYHDPAEHWKEANNRTNELDANAVVTVETFTCGECGKATAFEVLRTPEYTRDGQTAMSRNVRYSDGTLIGGEGTGAIKPFTDPKFENNVILTGTELLTMNTRPKNPANARNLNACVVGSSGSGKTRFWLTPQLLQAHSSYVVVDPKGGTLSQVGRFLQRKGYKIKVFNSIDFSKSMHYNPLAYVRNEADILKFVNTLISNTKGEGKESDPFWTKSETLLYCALIAYIIFEGPPEDRNMNTLVDMISGMEVKENDEDYMNAVDYMFAGLEKRKPDCFAVKQYKKYKLASGDVCSK